MNWDPGLLFLLLAVGFVLIAACILGFIQITHKVIDFLDDLKIKYNKPKITKELAKVVRIYTGKHRATGGHETELTGDKIGEDGKTCLIN